VRRLSNKCRKDNPHNWELYREAQRSCRKEVQKTSKETWRTFCSFINDLPRSASLHRAQSRDPKIKRGFLVAPYGGLTQSEGETLDHLLAIHFHNSLDIERETLPAAARRAKRLDWWVAARVIANGKVLWAIDSFALYKSSGMEGYFRLCYKKDGRFLSLTWSIFFVPAWRLNSFQPYDARLW
jgi:hypothetical protein